MVKIYACREAVILVVKRQYAHVWKERERSVCLSVCLSECLFDGVYVCLSVCLSGCLSV